VAKPAADTSGGERSIRGGWFLSGATQIFGQVAGEGELLEGGHDQACHSHSVLYGARKGGPAEAGVRQDRPAQQPQDRRDDDGGGPAPGMPAGDDAATGCRSSAAPDASVSGLIHKRPAPHCPKPRQFYTEIAKHGHPRPARALRHVLRARDTPQSWTPTETASTATLPADRSAIGGQGAGARACGPAVA
jgi:hypothetical protein